MNVSTRNIAVGLFILIGLALLGWMIIQFGARPRLGRQTYTLTMTFPSASGITDGSEVRIAGITIGHVRIVEPMDDFLGGIRIVADIEWRHNIPADSQAVITTGVGGLARAFIEIEVRPGARAVWLAKDDTASLDGDVRADGLIPPQMQQRFDVLAESLTRVADNLNALLVPLDASGQVAVTTQPEANISVSVRKLNALLTRMNEVFDEQDGDMAIMLANFRVVSQNAIEISKTLQDVSSRAVLVADSAQRTFDVATTQAEQVGQTATAELRRLGDALAANTVQLSEVLNSVNRAVGDLERGQGTLGRLMHDPTLFENMVLATDRMHRAIIEFERLLQEWQRDGMRLRLR